MAIGTLYLWLIAVPLKRGEAWAWWTFALSGTVGFLSFLTWLIYHYLDTWHLTASAALLPLYLLGMAITWKRLVSRTAPPWGHAHYSAPQKSSNGARGPESAGCASCLSALA